MHGALCNYMEHNLREASSETSGRICSSCVRKEITGHGSLGKPWNWIYKILERTIFPTKPAAVSLGLGTKATISSKCYLNDRHYWSHKISVVHLSEALIIHRILGSCSTNPWWLKWLMINALYWHLLPYSVSPFWIAYSTIYILSKCIMKGLGPEIFRFQSLLDVGVTASTSLSISNPYIQNQKGSKSQIFLDRQI